MQHMIAFAASWVMPTHTGAEALALILRWFHIIAGITWVGLLYFFNLVNVPFMKQVDAAMKPKVFQYLTLPALNWFRWSALLTVFLGFWYWAQLYVGPDAARMGVSPLSTMGLFLLVWIRHFYQEVARRLPQPLPGTGAIAEYAELGSFGMRVTMSYQPNTLAQQFTVDVLYGCGVLRNIAGVQVNT